MMAAQQQHIDASLQKMVDVLNGFSGNVKSNSNAMDTICESLSLPTEGPHYKRQKYGNEVNADRGAHIPDPGGVGVR
eukprot:6269221-Ditylum_brightwellii.AAC.1